MHCDKYFFCKHLTPQNSRDARRDQIYQVTESLWSAATCDACGQRRNLRNSMEMMNDPGAACLKNLKQHEEHSDQLLLLLGGFKRQKMKTNQRIIIVFLKMEKSTVEIGKPEKKPPGRLLLLSTSTIGYIVLPSKFDSQPNDPQEFLILAFGVPPSMGFTILLVCLFN